MPRKPHPFNLSEPFLPQARAKPLADRARTAAARAVNTATVVLAALTLAGCDKLPGNAPATATTAPPSAAETDFDAIVTACTRSVEGRTATVRPHGPGEWVKLGHSPALVQREVTRTESSITPYVGKIVVKDNEARATAPTEAAARAITLTPAHLLSNRTHTFVYRFDGRQWHWANGSRFTKTPSQSDVTVEVTQAELAAADSGFAGCLPR